MNQVSQGLFTLLKYAKKKETATLTSVFSYSCSYVSAFSLYSAIPTKIVHSEQLLVHTKYNYLNELVFYS